MRRLRAGDAPAAALLFDRHLAAMGAKAFAQLPAALRAKVGASDLVQDAYLAAFTCLGEFEDRGDGSFEAWLRRILDHRLADEVRRLAGTAKRDAGREVRLRTGGWAAVAATGGGSPSSVVATAEDAARVRAIVVSLPADYATVIRLVHLEGRTLVEAAARMGRSPDATRMLYGRAMDRLADRLGVPDDGTPR